MTSTNRSPHVLKPISQAARHFGVARPYNFSVAIPFVLSIIVAISMLTIITLALVSGRLSFGSERFVFLTYILVALLIAAALSRHGTLSHVLLSWCIAELIVAAISDTARPQNYFSEDRENRFMYHPLLQKVLRPSHVSVVRLDRRNSQAFARGGWLVNWDAVEGRDLRFVHNSLGTRGTEYTTADLSKPLIAVYGGSTTYDVTVTQGRTWVELLQSNLNDEFTVLNFGVPLHSTTEHLTQTAFYQRIEGRWPICALYYIGWNDIANAFTEEPDEAYADYLTLAQVVRKPDLYLAKYSPILKLANDVLVRRFDSVPRISKTTNDSPILASVEKLERIYIGHINTIKAINDSRGIRSVFIAQILNGHMDKLDPDRGPEMARAWLPLLTRFNSVLEQAATANGSNYIDPGMNRFRYDDFTDQGHFSESGAEKFARLLSGDVRKFCTAP